MRKRLLTQKGAALIEALVAFLVVTLGMVAMSQMRKSMRLDADIARQRSEAAQLAQQDIESLRARAALSTSASARGDDGIASSVADIEATKESGRNTKYKLKREVVDQADSAFKSIRVTVEWTDRNAGKHELALDTIIAGHDPALAAALLVVKRPVHEKRAWQCSQSRQ